MNYDHTFTQDDIDYGVVRGNHKIVFVKAGLGGDHVGDEGKYLIMARRLRETYGCSVIVSANPYDGRAHIRQNKDVIEQYMAEEQIDSPELFFFGHSNGGVKGLQLACAGVAFRRMILVNMPLMINFHKTKRYISEIPQTGILAVYGEKDPSYPYMPLLEGRAENLSAMALPQADHNFKGMLQEFIGLSDWLLADTPKSP